MTQAAHNRWKWIVGGLILFLLSATTIWQCVHIHEQEERIAKLEQKETPAPSDFSAEISALQQRVQALEAQETQKVADDKQDYVSQQHLKDLQVNVERERQKLSEAYREQHKSLQAQCQHLAALLKTQSLEQAKQSAFIESSAKEIAALHQALKQSEQQLQQLTTSSHPWSEWYDQYAERLFLCLAINPKTGSVGIGTAFVFDAQRSLLATNAHIVQLLRAMPQRFIIQNKTGRVFALKRAAHNPLFVTLTSPDVGLLEIDTNGVALEAMPLADEKELHNIAAGLSIGSMGFPGELQKQYQDLADETYPGALATFKQGWVGRVSDYDGVFKATEKNVLIQHSASLSNGTSGSPIFNQAGKVIAVSSSSMTSSFKVGHLRTRELLSAAEIAFAIRIDELKRFATTATLQTLPVKE